MASKIEWTQETWNPTTGCTRASEGCDNCYAVTMTKRLAAMGSEKYQGLVGNRHFNGLLKTHEDELEKPLRWRKPRVVFVNSMSDLFHKDVPFEFVDKVFAVMACAYWHTFQVLTKRPEQALEYLRKHAAGGRHIWTEGQKLSMPRGMEKPSPGWPLPNVWLGTSAETQEQMGRVEQLLRCPAAVRFVSAEPLLGPLELYEHLLSDYDRAALDNQFLMPLDGFNYAKVDWVIVGGESGPKARPMHPDWVRGIRDQCQAAGVAFFFKQWGAWAPSEEHPTVNESLPWHENGNYQGMARVGKKRAGRLLDGREWNEFPELRTEA